jgi:hypothetical protein
MNWNAYFLDDILQRLQNEMSTLFDTEKEVNIMGLVVGERYILFIPIQHESRETGEKEEGQNTKDTEEEETRWIEKLDKECEVICAEFVEYLRWEGIPKRGIKLSNVCQKMNDGTYVNKQGIYTMPIGFVSAVVIAN